MFDLDTDNCIINKINDDDEIIENNIDDEEDNFEDDNETEDIINYNNNNKTLLHGLEKYKNDSMIFTNDIKISTITIICNVNFSFNVKNIGLYFNDYDDILLYKHFNKTKFGKNTQAKIIKKKKVISKKKDEVNNFTSQVSFIFNSRLMNGETNFTKEKNINVKLFTNGSIHMTGTSNLNNIKTCIDILMNKLQNPITVSDKLIRFINDDRRYTIDDFKNLNICMINVTFVVQYNIDIEYLHESLSNSVYYETKKIYPYIEKRNLLIKYNINHDSHVTIFVYTTGSINISGKSYDDIYESYRFINKYIFSTKNVLSNYYTTNFIINILK